MARVLMFVVEDEEGEVVGVKSELADALRLKRQTPGSKIRQEWQQPSNRLYRSHYRTEL